MVCARDRVVGRWWVVVIGALLVGAATSLVGPTASLAAAADDDPRAVVAEDAAEEVITVMARNLYLGADVGVALELLPDLPAAAQFLWAQVAATDFDQRAPLLADEVVRDRPAVIGLQEATRWRCRPGNVGRVVDVYDFTSAFLAATRAAGEPYVVAAVDGDRAEQPGYRIPALPFLSRVTDADTFEPRFGRSTATCGFDLADALLVREDLADRVVAAGTRSFTDRYAVVPTVLVIDRGYAWADVAFDTATVRFVTTHLESLWDPDRVPHAARQATQLVADLADTAMPLVVLGDLNSDPRDPRGPDVPNPSGQPEASEVCPAQVASPTLATALETCSAYWILRRAGFDDAGPDPLAGAYLTWGTEAELAGPDPRRVDDALAFGNPAGFTDRLDYVLVRGGLTARDARIIGNEWPEGPGIWACDSPVQVANTEAMTRRLAAEGLTTPLTGVGRCLPTDHAGVVVDLALPATGDLRSAPPLTRWQAPIGPWGGVGLLLLALLGWRVVRRIRRRSNVEPAGGVAGGRPAGTG